MNSTLTLTICLNLLEAVLVADSEARIQAGAHSDPRVGQKGEHHIRCAIGSLAQAYKEVSGTHWPEDAGEGPVEL